VTEQAIGRLLGHGQLLNRGQTEIKTPVAVPEPASLAILATRWEECLPAVAWSPHSEQSVAAICAAANSLRRRGHVLAHGTSAGLRMAEPSAEHLAAYPEAGHAVMAVEYHRPIVSVSIAPDREAIEPPAVPVT